MKVEKKTHAKLGWIIKSHAKSKISFINKQETFNSHLFKNLDIGSVDHANSSKWKKILTMDDKTEKTKSRTYICTYGKSEGERYLHHLYSRKVSPDITVGVAPSFQISNHYKLFLPFLHTANSSTT